MSCVVYCLLKSVWIQCHFVILLSPIITVVNRRLSGWIVPECRQTFRLLIQECDRNFIALPNLILFLGRLFMNPPEYMEVQGKPNQPIVLPIAAGPASGHDWILELPAGVERIEDGPQRPVDPSTRLGSAVGGYLRVTAPAGTYLITARLARPWERDRPVRVVEIQLRVE
jgi:hypothetical protein